MPIVSYFSDQPGWAEQRPEYFWESLVGACQELWRQEAPTGVELRARIAGVALTSQRATVVNVDRNGCPLRPAIVWLDQRRTLGQRPVGGWWGLAFRLSGVSETVAYLQAEAEANWIRTNQPEIWAQTHKYLLPVGLSHLPADRPLRRLGGLPGGLHAVRLQGTALGVAEGLEVAGGAHADPAVLPELVPPAGRLGEITAEAAAATGIPVGLPLDRGGGRQGLRGDRRRLPRRRTSAA